MALLRPPAPPECEAAFMRSLPDFLSQPSERCGPTENYVGSPPAVPTLDDVLGPARGLQFDAQQVFVLALRDAATDAGAHAATPAGWQFFAGEARGAMVLGKLSPSPREGCKLKAAYYGDRAWDALQASKKLDSLPQVLKADYELRVLAVPGLTLETFWLVAGTKGFEDLVVPFSPIPEMGADGTDREEKVYTMARFLALIRPLAMQQMNARSVSD
jgi:hypothetical protein